ncbi:MAG: ACT domain-containing protein [Candidatus Melainabacteria bacterium]|nr:ACT domain-containing protein [Candidatus Melainabacteria bacterium]
MTNHILVTAVGVDRPGIVARITEVLVSHGANLEESRMAILGGEFAAVMLVTGEINADALLKDLGELEKDGISVTTKLTKPMGAEKYSAYVPCEIFLRGADHEGIVHSLSSQLRDKDVNIQSMHTEVISAPETGSPLFCMNATILLPPSIPIEEFKKELQRIGDAQNVDIELKTRKEAEVKAGR